MAIQSSMKHYLYLRIIYLRIANLIQYIIAKDNFFEGEGNIEVKCNYCASIVRIHYVDVTCQEHRFCKYGVASKIDLQTTRIRARAREWIKNILEIYINY